MGYVGPEGSLDFSLAAQADILKVVQKYHIDNGEPGVMHQSGSLITGEETVYRLGASEQLFDRGGGLGEETLPTYYISEEKTQIVDEQWLDTESSAGVITPEQIAASGLLCASIEWRYDIARDNPTRMVRLSLNARVRRIDFGEPKDTLMQVTNRRPDREVILPEPPAAKIPLRQWRTWIAQDRKRRQARDRVWEGERLISRTEEQLNLRHLIAAINAFGGKTKRLQKRLDRDDNPLKRYRRDEYGKFVRQT